MTRKRQCGKKVEIKVGIIETFAFGGKDCVFRTWFTKR